VCGLYRGAAERDEILIRFIEAGLHGGDRCVAVIDQVSPREVIDRVHEGIGAEDLVALERLEVSKAAEGYLRSGRFSADYMIDFLTDRVASSARRGRPQVRAVAEMSWIRATSPVADRLYRYETALNNFTAQHPPILLCLYDLDLFDGTAVLALLRTHPKLLLGGIVLDNPHCANATSGRIPRQSPDGPATAPAERHVAGHVAEGLSNAATADVLFVSPHTVDAHLKHIYTKLGLHSRVQLTRLVLQHAARG
jgi:DNA-binding CsgD family transcriptional regulator